MEVDIEPDGIRRVQELWFEDGNLVIQAGRSQFRVYRGVLAARSSVFQDMLSFPQPPDSELVEGCPLVRLHDNPAEVSVFLKAIFNSEFFEMYPTPTRLEIIAGVLRLSHKYSVDYLRRRALVHLSSAFFTTLSAVNSASGLTAAATDASLWTRPSWDMSSESRHLSYAIQLAREVGALWVLPYAFYELARICAEGPDILTCLKPGNFNGVSTQLSEDDQIAFVKGYCVQISSSTSGILRFLQDPASIPGCSVGYDCLLGRLNASALAESDRLSPEYLADPLFLWYESDWERLADVCGMCLRSLKGTHQSACQTFWDQLPQMYGLPGWEELEKMKADSLGTA
ncbi:hypothetical protein C8R44DRAFT_673527 [Mycena epipterygia]|nr:hypothetical protein C8R44DRAFT_673527 [Mycena epipterygia]